MKKTYPASKNSRSVVSYRKHLKPEGKRSVNKSTRAIQKKDIKDGQA